MYQSSLNQPFFGVNGQPCFPNCSPKIREYNETIWNNRTNVFNGHMNFELSSELEVSPVSEYFGSKDRSNQSIKKDVINDVTVKGSINFNNNYKDYVAVSSGCGLGTPFEVNDSK